MDMLLSMAAWLNRRMGMQFLNVMSAWGLVSNHVLMHACSVPLRSLCTLGPHKILALAHVLCMSRIRTCTSLRQISSWSSARLEELVISIRSACTTSCPAIHQSVRLGNAQISRLPCWAVISFDHCSRKPSRPSGTPSRH